MDAARDRGGHDRVRVGEVCASRGWQGREGGGDGFGGDELGFLGRGDLFARSSVVRGVIDAVGGFVRTGRAGDHDGAGGTLEDELCGEKLVHGVLLDEEGDEEGGDGGARDGPVDAVEAG